MPEARLRRTKEEVLKNFRTDEIVQAARRVIAELGFADASMERIAHEAGVAKGTIYLYFQDRDDLLCRTSDHAFGELFAQLDARLEAATGRRARLEALVSTMLDYSHRRREFFRLYAAMTAHRKTVDGTACLLHRDSHHGEHHIHLSRAGIQAPFLLRRAAGRTG